MIKNSCQIILAIYRIILLEGVRPALAVVNTTLTAKHQDLINYKKEELKYQQWQIQSLKEIKTLLSQPPVTPNDLP